MALRDFTDASGTVWQVWDVMPAHRQAGRALYAEGMAGGWLCFECAREKRRLAPVPERWAEYTDVEMAACLGRAEAVRERTTSPAPP